jgi:thymidylate kinase
MNAERGGLYNVEGLDATGKSTLTKELQKAFNGVMTYCPPDWMRPYRTFFNSSNIDMRFLYYALSNFWVDKAIVQPLLKRDGQYVFQDRTWLTTLSAHEDMGTSPFWLHLGLKLAKTATRPDIAFIIRVDNAERRLRMMTRDIITPDDLESLNNQDAMEQSYVKWADRLEWNKIIFDNTHFTPDEARDTLVNQINGWKS